MISESLLKLQQVADSKYTFIFIRKSAYLILFAWNKYPFNMPVGYCSYENKNKVRCCIEEINTAKRFILKNIDNNKIIIPK